jgi:cyclophilin family peptidyl-prolyl cis-trans isomerase
MNTLASGNQSHAEGYYSTASGNYGSHAEGGYTKALGNYSHAEGRQTTASGNYSHSEGAYTTASNYMSHAEGSNTVANGNRSHAEGWSTTSSGLASHASGYGTIAYTDYQTTMGKFNTTGNTSQFFIIGNGTNTSTRSNALRVSSNGNMNIAGTLTQGSADYAEFFESLNGDKISFGTVVELSNGKIIECQDSNNAIGVISSRPMIVGNAEDGTGDEWVGKYLKDEWGNFITEEYEYVDIDDNNNEIIKIGIRNKINTNFDSSIEYIKREDRPEWNIVGLLGQIRILKNQQIPNKWIKLYDVNDDIAMYFVR